VIRQLIPEEQLLLAECHIDRLASIQQAPEAQTNQQRTAETEAPPPTGARSFVGQACTADGLTRHYARTLLID
jgi:hypothetical protein